MEVKQVVCKFHVVCVSLQLSLTVDHPQKVLIMGEAMDFGTCKAKKKERGLLHSACQLGTPPCSNIILFRTIS